MIGQPLIDFVAIGDNKTPCLLLGTVDFFILAQTISAFSRSHGKRYGNMLPFR